VFFFVDSCRVGGVKWSYMSQDIVQKTKTKLQELGRKKRQIVADYIKELQDRKLSDIRKSLGL
jgi:hypothetical protein